MSRRATLPRFPRRFKPDGVLRIDTAIGCIQQWAALHETRPHTIARALGMSPSVLRDMMKQHWNPTVKTLRRVEAYMRFHLEINRAP